MSSHHGEHIRKTATGGGILQKQEQLDSEFRTGAIIVNEIFDNSKIAVWILGLHHSGTTIFWKAFRADPRFLCFDEPLTDFLGVTFPDNNEKNTFNEYQRVFSDDPGKFWDLYASITPQQELDQEFTLHQEKYLRTLLNCGEHVVIDETHLHAHVPAIKKINPTGHVIHLHRRASGFVTSHLRPKWDSNAPLLRRTVRRLRHEYNKFTFWDRHDFLPGMRRNEVIGNHPDSKFGLLLSQAGYDAKQIMSSSSIVKLLAYWHYQYHHLEKNGPSLFKDRFKSLRYEDFASRPEETMAMLYSWLGMQTPVNIEYTGVYPPKPAYKATDRRWLEAARLAGFSDEELVTLL